MRTRFASVLLIMLLAGTSAWAQEDEAGRTRIYLKTGESFSGVVIHTDERGVKLDLGQGLELFIRWNYTRGDRHVLLRRGAVNFQDVVSIVRFADFCHDFALDEHEAEALKLALRIDPDNGDLRARLERVELLLRRAPEPEPPAPAPVPPVVERPAPREPDPAPSEARTPPAPETRAIFYFSKGDAATEAVLKQNMKDFGYQEGTRRRHDYRVEIEAKVTMIRNPTWFGAELYAVFEGEIHVKIFRQGETEHFGERFYRVPETRADNRAEASRIVRRDLCRQASQSLHTIIAQRG
jgi:hypothetical protein